MKLLTSISLVILSFFSTAQTPIYLEEHSVYITPKNCHDSIIKKIGNKTIRVYLRDCRGEMFCEVLINNKIVEKGNYQNSLDALKQYFTTTSRGAHPVKRNIEVKPYFQPLRTGDWEFYDSYNKKYIRKTYDRGLEIDIKGD